MNCTTGARPEHGRRHRTCLLSKDSEPPVHPARVRSKEAALRATLTLVSLTGAGRLAVSPDGRWLLYPQVDQAGSDILLVENFR